MTRADLPKYLEKTVELLGGKGSILQISKMFWANFGDEICENDDLFYSWQYDIRWAATELRQLGIMKSKDQSPRGIWELNKKC